MMKPRDLANRLSIIFTLLTVSALSLFAQSSGQIAGTVVDANGGVIPGATVTVTGSDGHPHKVNKVRGLLIQSNKLITNLTSNATTS